ncbi:MAG: PrsW family intramembrane metalloprotease [Anaerolineales bacterium]|nr:PrsW family intramembrane metalloprotease [Anaerolineales bacterium]
MGDARRSNSVTAPILEEILKSLILIYLVKRAEFNYVVDGAIYGFGAGLVLPLSKIFNILRIILKLRYHLRSRAYFLPTLSTLPPAE